VRKHWHLADEPGKRSSYGHGFKTRKAAMAILMSVHRHRASLGLGRKAVYLDSCDQADCRMVGSKGE